jgi:hypothetical protein
LPTQYSEEVLGITEDIKKRKSLANKIPSRYRVSICTAEHLARGPSLLPPDCASTLVYNKEPKHLQSPIQEAPSTGPLEVALAQDLLATNYASSSFSNKPEFRLINGVAHPFPQLINQPWVEKMFW